MNESNFGHDTVNHDLHLDQVVNDNLKEGKGAEALVCKDMSGRKTESPVLTAIANVDQRRTNPDSSEHSSQQKGKDNIVVERRSSRFDQLLFHDVVMGDVSIPARKNLSQILSKEHTPHFVDSKRV